VILRALLVTILVEAPLVGLVYRRLSMALVCAVTTGVTNFVMNRFLFRALRSAEQYVLIGELGAVVVEALIYFLVAREQGAARAIDASALANSASFVAGWWLV
jgi:hypothetical protein